MAQHDRGQKQQARKTLAAAIVAFDWSESQADSRDMWIAHILRRDAEALIFPNLRAYVHGEYQPADNDERAALVATCQFQGRCHAAAQLYVDAFAADPALVEQLTSPCRSRGAWRDKQGVARFEELVTACRYPAARCAALAGCGLGADGAPLSAAERTHWRKQARDWLRADLAMWTNMLDSNFQRAQVLANRQLTRWQTDPDLAGLREPAALDKLPADERAEWLTLWKEVDLVLERTKAAR
jgi:serine/threonine-protein kinase